MKPAQDQLQFQLQVPPAAGRILLNFTHSMSNVTSFYWRLVAAPCLSPANIDFKILRGDMVKIFVQEIPVYYQVPATLEESYQDYFTPKHVKPHPLCSKA